MREQKGLPRTGRWRASLQPALGRMEHVLLAPLPCGLWVTAFPQKDLSWADQDVPSTQRGLCLHGLSGGAGSTRMLAASAATALSASRESSRRTPYPGTSGGQTFWPSSRARLRLTIAQVCVRRQLARFPGLLRGSEGEEWRGRGEEVSRRDRRGERGSTGQGWGTSSLRKHGRRRGSESGAAAGARAEFRVMGSTAGMSWRSRNKPEVWGWP